MADLNSTPAAGRVHIGFFGLRNAGKSTLVNAFASQNVAIVSDVAGTTTDPVSKSMEITPLGPCMLVDTAGLDDVGELGEMRVKKTLGVLATCDIAVWVEDGVSDGGGYEARFLKECARLRVKVFRYRRGDDVEKLKSDIAACDIAEKVPGLFDGLVKKGDRVLFVCPIDSSAPKGRLILPQVQAIRECLDIGAIAEVRQPFSLTGDPGAFDLVVTDSQAFAEVAAKLPAGTKLTGFSVLFARQKGDIEAYARGLAKIPSLEDGDRILVAEGCTHRRHCEDIGTVKIPRALERLSGKKLEFFFSSGGTFDVDAGFSLAVQCGGCMLTRREVLRRIALCESAGVPVVNYGMLLAAAAGIKVDNIVPDMVK